jgi:hypothetical protein
MRESGWLSNWHLRDECGPVSAATNVEVAF